MMTGSWEVQKSVCFLIRDRCNLEVHRAGGGLGGNSGGWVRRYTKNIQVAVNYIYAILTWMTKILDSWNRDWKREPRQTVVGSFHNLGKMKPHQRTLVGSLFWFAREMRALLPINPAIPESLTSLIALFGLGLLFICYRDYGVPVTALC